MSAQPSFNRQIRAAQAQHDSSCDCCGSEINTTPVEDALHDSVDFVAEAMGELDWTALAKAWQGRDEMEILRLMDNAYQAYKQFHVGKALEDAQPRKALQELRRVYA